MFETQKDAYEVCVPFSEDGLALNQVFEHNAQRSRKQDCMCTQNACTSTQS